MRYSISISENRAADVARSLITATFFPGDLSDKDLFVDILPRGTTLSTSGAVRLLRWNFEVRHTVILIANIDDEQSKGGANQ